MTTTNYLNALTCHLLPAKGRFCQSQFHAQHEQSYSLWSNITANALKEEKNDDLAANLSSDSFLEYDELVTLNNPTGPIGLFMFRWIDLAFTSNQSLSGIKNRFPQTLLDALAKKKFSKIMLMGNLAVDPNWRRSKVGFGVADMLMTFAVTRFLESDAQVLLTTTRNNRSTNTLCYRQGGSKYADNGIVFGVESDVVLFHRDDIKPLEIPLIYDKAKSLWQSKQNAWIDMPLHFIGKNHG